MSNTKIEADSKSPSLVAKFLAKMRDAGPTAIVGGRASRDLSKVPAFLEALKLLGDAGTGKGWPVPEDLIPGARTVYLRSDERPATWFPIERGDDGMRPKSQPKDSKLSTDAWLDAEYSKSCKARISASASLIRDELERLDSMGDYRVQVGAIGEGYGIVATYCGRLTVEQVAKRASEREAARLAKSAPEVSAMVDEALADEVDEVDEVDEDTAEVA